MSKCVTEKVKFSCVNVAGEREAYSICLQIPKEDAASLAKIQQAIDEATQEGIADTWNGRRPEKLRTPLRSGENDLFFINATSWQRPEVVDKDLHILRDPGAVKSGDWGKASITFFPYRIKGSCGIGAGLNNIQLLSF